MVSILTLSTLSIFAQNSNSTYFLNEWSGRHKNNASFAPEYGYFAIGTGSINLNLSSNTGLSNYIYPGTPKPITFLDSSVNAQTFLNKLSPINTIGQSLDLQLLSFGFYTSRYSFWSFDLSLKEDLNINIPKDFFAFSKLMMAKQNNVYDLTGFGMSQNNFMEASLGYSREINSKLRIGVKVKGLAGLASTKFNYSQFKINLSNDRYEINSVGEMQIRAAQVSFPTDTAKYFDLTKQPSINAVLKPAGMGAAFDFGITYKPLDKLTLAAAVNNIGYIKWDASSITKGVASGNILYTGFSNINMDSINASLDAQIETLQNQATGMMKFKETATSSDVIEQTPFTTNLSAEYSIFGNDKHDILLGVLWNTYNRDTYHKNNLVTALTLKPLSWFTVTGNCELLRQDASRYGLAFNFSPRWANFYIAADYVGPKMLNPQFIPINGFNYNISTGFCFVLGRPQDKDHDGIVDRRDKCPNTPLLVKVDKKGCPLDEDNDGVPDYKDQCPKTLAEVKGMVDSIGCPYDKDNDGVPDYMDQCLNTPLAARGFVNDKGCPLDTDNDGIFDYMDKCLNTPTGVQVDGMGCPIDTDNDGVPDFMDKCPGTVPEAKGKLDANGCPLDSDGDGVPDYLDKCPDTPADARATVSASGCASDDDNDGIPNHLDKCPNTPTEAQGKVDKNGCPQDTDGDGVADYLDKCPDTPLASQKMVDKNGCPQDSDGDLVPDYLDKCPNTPLEAKEKVDSTGCPIDTDKDGIVDYLDNCPTTKGVESNFGCPELKKEVRTLFQKALSGIQFETGNATLIKASFIILDQIKQVLTDNPTYLIEVRGHTDNVGKPELNLALSDKRAASVKDYLVSKGIDPKRITSKGFGDTRPVAPNKTAAGKAKNRRVEFTVIFEEVKFE